MSVRDQLNNAIYNGLRKNHQKLMSSVAINTGAVADHLLAQGWRPPMRVIETVEELDAADAEARRVVRAVRAEDFRMAEQAPDFFEEYAAICQDARFRAPEVPADSETGTEE